MRQPECADFETSKMQNMNKIAELGINIYPYEFNRDHSINQIQKEFGNIGHEKSENLVRVAGRIYNIRHHGGVAFVDIRDESGKIQLYIRKNDIGSEKFDIFKKFFDPGDFIGVEGQAFRSKKGELTLWVNSFELLSKSINPLPEKFHGLKDVETRYRQRYLDLIANEENRDIFIKRSKIISSIRRDLEDKGFHEFDTPVLQPIYGGANARPFTTYHHFLDQKFYLRIAPELYLKRLIVSGYEKVFEIAKNFRNEDVDTLHNPEFTILEIYEAYRDYRYMLELCEDLISRLILEFCGSHEIEFGNLRLDFRRPWKRITMDEAVKNHLAKDISNYSIGELKEVLKEKGAKEYEKVNSYGDFLVQYFESFIEKNIMQPTFICDYPIEISPLAKEHRNKKGFTERFELFINGWEIANGFSELNDPLEQKSRFIEQDRKRQLGDLEAQMIDYDYITALGYGMPPTGGVGIGIDRLVMLITNKDSIKEVILFPQMKLIKECQEENDAKSS